MQLSLCMIVRDSAGTLAECLSSIRPHVDEAVIVDTGSKDETVAIASEFGAQVFYFPWCDSFAAARNESLRHARGEWIFWMDADDTTPPECGARLRELTDQPPNILGVIVAHIHCPLPEAVNVVDHVKLVRNRADLRFEGRVHEQILPAIYRAGGEVARSDIYVVHSGADFTPQARATKRERYRRLLELELAVRPDDPFALFNLGVLHYEADDYGRAVETLERSRAAMPKAYVLLADSYRKLGERDRAEDVVREGRRRFPEDAELRFQEGLLTYETGRLDDAIDA